jgi:drug/metabolite transporter (DMT)-like permease
MGELLALLSACCFAIANVTIMRGAGAKGQDNGAFLSILITAALACVVWLYHGLKVGWPQLNGAGLLWFAGAGVLTIFIGRVFLYASVQHLGAFKASAVKRLNPLFSVLLGVLVLGESIDLNMAFGMLLIFSSFGLLLKQSLPAAADGAAAAQQPRRQLLTTLRNLGFFYGPASAMAYATGYVARKQGLDYIADPAFGTMLGSITGALFFVLAARFIDSYRHAMHSALTVFNPWLLAAGILSSMGQLLTFMALSYTTISRVALISSMEAFVTIFVSIVVFRTGEKLSVPLLLAAALGVMGTVFIVAH